MRKLRAPGEQCSSAVEMSTRGEKGSNAHPDGRGARLDPARRAVCRVRGGMDCRGPGGEAWWRPERGCRCQASRARARDEAGRHPSERGVLCAWRAKLKPIVGEQGAWRARLKPVVGEQGAWRARLGPMMGEASRASSMRACGEKHHEARHGWRRPREGGAAGAEGLQGCGASAAQREPWRAMLEPDVGERCAWVASNARANGMPAGCEPVWPADATGAWRGGAIPTPRLRVVRVARSAEATMGKQGASRGVWRQAACEPVWRAGVWGFGRSVTCGVVDRGAERGV